MSRTRVVSMCTAVVGMMVLAGASQADDAVARNLMKKVIAAIPTTSVSARATLASHGDVARELRVARKQTADGIASYLEVTAPANLKDTRFLFFERGPRGTQQFIYLPTAKRAAQVDDNTRQQPFLGSEFSVVDLVVPDPAVLAFEFSGQDAVGERRCKLVRATPTTKAGQSYSKLVFCIDPAVMAIARTEFYDSTGKLLKVWTVDKLEKIDGIPTGVEHKIVNVQRNTGSTLTLSEVRYHAVIADETFSKPYLER